MTESEINEILAAMDTIARAVYRLPRERQGIPMLLLDKVAVCLGVISMDDFKSLLKEIHERTKNGSVRRF